ncbi:MAG TPA: rhomboid family intramembrane serine protease [Thermoanaerobaculia bacterium]|nr:rhomboid family intramembrane serine protease [Thermoanaerobaculia bacterium]
MLSILRRAPLTGVLLAAIVLVFVLETLAGGSTNQAVLLQLGANRWPLDGAWWRLLASMFLHIGVVHLVVNAWALYQLCGLFEVWLGSARLAVVYFVSGLTGSFASLVFTLEGTQRVSAGASGAIFGVLGALVTFLALRRDRLRPQARSLLFQLLFWAGLNVVLGFSAPGIDNGAHLGGFAAGLVLGAVVAPRRRERPPEPAGLHRPEGHGAAGHGLEERGAGDR